MLSALTAGPNDITRTDRVTWPMAPANEPMNSEEVTEVTNRGAVLTASTFGAVLDHMAVSDERDAARTFGPGWSREELIRVAALAIIQAESIK